MPPWGTRHSRFGLLGSRMNFRVLHVVDATHTGGTGNEHALGCCHIEVGRWIGVDGKIPRVGRLVECEMGRKRLCVVC